MGKREREGGREGGREVERERRQRDRQTDRQRDRQTDRQTEREREREREGGRERESMYTHAPGHLHITTQQLILISLIRTQSHTNYKYTVHAVYTNSINCSGMTSCYD